MTKDASHLWSSFPCTDRHLLDFHDRGVAAFGSMSRIVEALLAFRERKTFMEKGR